MMVAIIVVGYLMCSFVAYGLTLGGFTHRFPYMSNIWEAIVFPIFGPFTIFAVAITLGWHWRLVPIPKEERWKIFEREYEFLDRSYFEERHG